MRFFHESKRYLKFVYMCYLTVFVLFTGSIQAKRGDPDRNCESCYKCNGRKKEKIRQLIDICSTQNWKERRITTEKIAEYGIIAIPILKEFLLGKNPKKRWCALYPLKIIGEKIQAFEGTWNNPISHIIELLSDEETGIRILAAQTLGAIKSKNPAITKALLNTIKNDKHSAVRALAINALGETGVKSNEVIEQLITTFNDKIFIVRYTAAEVIGKKIGKKALPKLLETLKNSKDNKKVRISTIKAIGLIGSQAKEAVPNLVNMLKNTEDESIRGILIFALINVGKASIPNLINLWEENIKSDLKIAIIKIFTNIGLKAKQAVSLLLHCLETNKDWRLRGYSARALGYIGAGGEIVEKTLINTLKHDSHPSVRYYAAFALGNIKTKSKEVVKELIIAFKDQDGDVSMSASLALSRIGKFAIPELIQALNSKRNIVRFRAVRALGYIGDKEAIEPIKKLIEVESYPLILKAAKKALKEIIGK